MNLWLKRMHEDAILPSRQTPGSSGFDLHARLDYPQTIMRGRRAKIPTGWAMQIVVSIFFDGLSCSWEGQIRPRSGLGLEHGVVAQFGTIDNDYRGEVSVVIENGGMHDFIVQPGMRIAQLVICPIALVDDPDVVSDLTPTSRGDGGFGSTGGV